MVARSYYRQFEAEMRVPLEPVLVVLAMLGLVVVPLGSDARSAVGGVNIYGFALLFPTAAALAWLLHGKWPALGRWMVALSFAGLIQMGRLIGAPAFSQLLVLPTVLAAALIGAPAAAVTAGGTLVAIWFLPGAEGRELDLAGLLATSVANAGVVGVAGLLQHNIVRYSRWMWESFTSSQTVLEDVRRSRMALEQSRGELENANRQLLMAGERMSTLRSIAEDAQKTKAAFVAKVSHEFRTPLNMIIGLAELMFEAPQIYTVALPPQMKEDLEVLLRNCRHLSSMIDDVLDLTRIESGRVALRKERIDLVAIVAEAAVAVRPLTEKKGLYLRVETPADLPEVYCDRTRIRQVILNLVSNAARFTDVGGITITLRDSGPSIRVTVADTGLGIADEDVDRIFEPFSQGNAATWRDRGGSGLGLSISRQFVRLHQGRMWLESAVGEGSRFIFELPVSPPVAHTAPAGRWIRSDWVWREGAFRTERSGIGDLARRPVVGVCDQAGYLQSELARYADDVDVVGAVTLEGLDGASPDVLIVNAGTFDGAQAVLDTVRQRATPIPVVCCDLVRPAKRVDCDRSLKYLVKPVSRRSLNAALATLGCALRRVLVVDDDPQVRGLFQRMLELFDETLEVECAADGLSALTALNGGDFDLVLLDLLLPDMEGWDVLAHLRELPGQSELPVFFVTAQDPLEEPASSSYVLTSALGGFSIPDVLRRSLQLAQMAVTPDSALDSGSQRTDGAAPASPESAARPAPVRVPPP